MSLIIYTWKIPESWKGGGFDLSWTMCTVFFMMGHLVCIFLVTDAVFYFKDGK